jgi:hypothetical protein
MAMTFSIDLTIHDEESRDPEGAQYGSLYYGFFRCFATEYRVSSGSFPPLELSALLAIHFADDHMKKALFGVQKSMYSVVAPRELLKVTFRYATSMVFYGWLIDRWMRRVCYSSH